MFVVIVVFMLSGAAGLVYESVWSRYLALFVGHSAHAQVIVLVIFLGGMSAGAYVASRHSHRVRRPLLMYAYVEFAIGVIAILFDDIYGLTTRVTYDSVFPSLANGSAVVIVKWVLASILILPQSILLGATFPLMSAGALRFNADEPGRTLGLLYFANSLGAAVGVLLSGFVLIPAVGLPGALLTAALTNIGVALAVALYERRLTSRHDTASPEQTAPHTTVSRQDGTIALSTPLPTIRVLRKLLLGVAFGTAVASFIYEIAWIRMLSLVLGSATHSFELMLSAFILGLALGAYWIRTRADGFGDPIRALGLVQWMMGVAAIATLPLYVASFDWMATIQRTFQANDDGYNAFLLVRYTICLAVMLPATFCAGMTLPLITRTLLLGGVGERSIGAVYAINTLGSIVGVGIAGLLLMPLLGLKLLLILGAVLDIALGAMLLWPRLRYISKEQATLIAAGAAATVTFVVGTAMFLRFDRAMLTSGVFRHGRIVLSRNHRIDYYRDGRTATVSVRRANGGGFVLTTNGKPDASLDPMWLESASAPDSSLPIRGDMSAQLVLPLVTIAHAPRARAAAVIGQGSGISSNILLGSPHLRQLTTIEIEPEMIRASRLFIPINRRVFEDARSTFVIDDARSFFAASPLTFDLILSEPSNPWVSGVSGLFTLEFYQRIRLSLSPRGVFGQWLQAYEMDDDLVMSVLAALDAVFDDYEIFSAGSGDILVLATAGGRLPEADWAVVDFPGIREDLQKAVRFAPEALNRLRVASRAAMHPLLASEQPNSDFRPLLDLGAERARFLKRSAVGLLSLSEHRFDLVAALTKRRYAFGTYPVAVMPDVAPLAGLAFGARVRHGFVSSDRAPTRPERRSPRVRNGELPSEEAENRAARAFGAALNRRALLDALSASNRPPPDWRAWFEEVATAEADVHRGTAGVADESFYGRVIGYVLAQRGPTEVMAALNFLHGLAAWDFEQIIAASPTLEAEQLAGRPWIKAELLRDATVAAHLATGDIGGARTRMEALTPFGNQDDKSYQFRSRFLLAHLQFASRNGPSASAPHASVLVRDR